MNTIVHDCGGAGLCLCGADDPLDLVALAEQAAIVDGVPTAGSVWVFRPLWVYSRRRKLAEISTVADGVVSGVYPSTGVGWSLPIGEFLGSYVPAESLPAVDELGLDELGLDVEGGAS